MRNTTRPSTALDFGPVIGSDRVEVIDVLRGFALLGILLVNMTMDLPWVRLVPRISEHPSIDRFLYTTIDVLAEGKFYVLFSFLFGLGFAIQMNRANASGRGFVLTYTRRLAVLYAIGLVLTWLTAETQLRIYATLGVLLLALRHVPPKVVLALAIGLLPFTPVNDLSAAWQRRGDAVGIEAHAAERIQNFHTRTQRQASRALLHATGSFRQIVASHTPTLWSWSWLTGEFPFLLLGLYVGRRRIHERLIELRPLMRRLASWGLAIGLPGSVLAHVLFERRQLWEFTSPRWWAPETAELLDRIASPALTFFYAAAIVLLFTRGRWLGLLRPLAPVGRMALSNYIFQWVAFTLLTNSFGFGLYGKFGFTTGLLLASLVFVVQLVVSRWYLRRFRFGPAEWMWRSATYWQPQPLKSRVNN